MIKKIIEKVCISFFLIYFFNIVGVNFDIIIPINIITLSIVFLYKVSGLLILIFSLIVLF